LGSFALRFLDLLAQDTCSCKAECTAHPYTSGKSQKARIEISYKFHYQWKIALPVLLAKIMKNAIVFPGNILSILLNQIVIRDLS
jgi:hypothetical protein